MHGIKLPGQFGTLVFGVKGPMPSECSFSAQMPVGQVDAGTWRASCVRLGSRTPPPWGS